MDEFVVKRVGNYFKVRKTPCRHYYISLLLGNATVTAWHRISKKKLEKEYEIVENYNGDNEKFKW